jgi:hypothetical protein
MLKLIIGYDGVALLIGPVRLYYIIFIGFESNLIKFELKIFYLYLT